MLQATATSCSDQRGRRAGKMPAALVGNFAAAEFAQVRARLVEDLAVCDFADPAGLLQGLPRDSGLELVFVAQQRPRQWHGDWIDRLRRRAPLIRTVAVLGTWCAGETRTGSPLRTDARLFWHEFPEWWARQWELLQTGKAPQWSFLQPQPQSERRVVECVVSAASRGLVIVSAPDRNTAEALGLACDVGGWSTAWARLPRQLPLLRGATAILFDTAQLEVDERSAVRRLRAIYGALPVIVLSDLPLDHQVDFSRELAIQRVLGKPFEIDDLHAALDQAVRGYRKISYV